MKIEVGKKYRLGTGEIVLITEEQGGVYNFVGEVEEEENKKYYSFTNDGHCFVGYSVLSDIIEEYNEE